MIRHEIKYPDDPHWDSMWEEISKKEYGKIVYPYDVNGFLLKYKGRTYIDPRYTELKVYGGIEFNSEEDLVFFKLTFN